MILDDILAAKRSRLNELKNDIPYNFLEIVAANRISKPLDLYSALKQNGLSVIAEVKKASPSKGVIAENFEPVKRALEYEANGAAAISVLTEEDYFKGSMDYLAEIKKQVKIPVLCKDFIIEEYQILHAFSAGADAILLIASILSDEELQSLFKFASSLGLSCLMEAHNAREVSRCVKAGGNIIGINNRDLTTFNIDLNNFANFRQLIPDNCAAVCESGIMNEEDALFAKKNGADAILVGESLMREENSGSLLRRLLEND